MLRLLAIAGLTVLLLAGGAQAALLGALAPEGCDAMACCCSEDLPAGPTLLRECCCSYERAPAPEEKPDPAFEPSERVSAPDFALLPVATVRGMAPPVEAGPGATRPIGPRAPPGGLLQLYCVMRC